MNIEQECQEKINENMAYALQYMDSYDYRMNLGKLKKEVNNIILIYTGRLDPAVLSQKGRCVPARLPRPDAVLRG